MRCHPARWVWGLIPIVMLSWVAVQVEADRIEHDLEQRTRSALLSAGHDWASVVFSGRDGVLVGTPQHAHQRAEALALVRNVWGARVVVPGMRHVEELALSGSYPVRASALDPVEKLKTADVSALRAVPAASVAEAAELLPVHGDLPPNPVRAPAPPSVSETAADAQKPQAGGTARAIETATIATPATTPSDACRSVAHDVRTSAPIRFARGKAELSRRSRALLDHLITVLNNCAQASVEVGGHADTEGPAWRNLSLSQRRAGVVVRYLISKGIDAGRLKAVGYGETRPVAPNDTAQNRAKNRRIEVEVTRPIPEVSTARQGVGNGLPDH